MSGPKSSYYRVSPQQIAVLEEERRKELERRRVEAEQKRLEEERKRLEAEKEHCRKLLRTTMNQQSIHEGLLEKEMKISEELLLLSCCNHDFGKRKDLFSKKILETDNKIRELVALDDLESLKRAIQDTKEIEKEVQSEFLEIMKIAKENRENLKAVVTQELEKGFSVSFELEENESNSLHNPAYLEEKLVDSKALSALQDKIGEKCSLLLENSLLPEKMRRKIDAISSNVENATDEKVLKNTYAIEILPFLKECQALLKEIATYQEEFTSLSCEYTYLFEMVSQPQSLTQLHLKDLSPSLETINLLKKEVKILSKLVQEEEEKAYIQTSIHEVMEEMGYHILGSRDVTKKNGTQLKNELFHYDDGTAVNVSYSSNGQIAMELGGLAQDNHLPDEEESTVLCEAMSDFCGNFTVFEERLAEKGVVLENRLSHFPPEKAYAQIINVEDYELSTEVSLLEKEKKTKKNVKTVKKSKYME